ncbi:MAG TPA: rhodanese-like domain-containing protein [Candidatus Binatia bacterium]|nr:rhodanese-like domain-containing protein [Candidatus Binatia bacterium]
MGERLGFALAGLTRGDKNAPLAFFCLSAECWLSYNAALRARTLGYTAVSWYRGGVKAWEAAGLDLLDAVQHGQLF